MVICILDLGCQGAPQAVVRQARLTMGFMLDCPPLADCC